MIQPVIKWSGSKRSQAERITDFIVSRSFGTYYEPFCGGCSVLAKLLERKAGIKHFVCSDLNNDLINTWNSIKTNPKSLINGYHFMWSELNKLKDGEDKKKYFYSIRNRLNRNHAPMDFLFIMRTTTNGMPRYNGNGEFNNSLHITRPGINPDTLEKIVMQWHNLLNSFDVQFVCRDYQSIHPGKNDICYFDSPYANTKGMYYGKIDETALFSFLGTLESDWLLSYDGYAGNDNLVSKVPETLYKRHLFLESGNSSFRRVIGNNRHCNVRESLYMNFEQKETVEVYVTNCNKDADFRVQDKLF